MMIGKAPDIGGWEIIAGHCRKTVSYIPYLSVSFGGREDLSYLPGVKASQVISQLMYNSHATPNLLYTACMAYTL